MSGPSSIASRLADTWTRVRRARGRWLALALVVAIMPVAGMFSPSHFYSVRDLTLYYWPKYRWLRASIFNGQSPWWDPYMAAGQSAAVDAMSQLFFLPTLLLRLALPEPLGFNVWVALPYPLAALGMYLFARRHLRRPAAAVAAIIYAVSGPVVSSSDFPNLSWSLMALPWVLWATDEGIQRPGGRTLVLLACCVATQVLAGEPVTMAATMALATAYAAWRLLGRRLTWTARARAMALVAVGIAAGAALSAVQLLPTMHAVAHSPRVTAEPEYFWSLHPLSLVETIEPYLFGDHFQWLFLAFPWMRALSNGRDPFFFSIYYGVTVFALATLGMFVARRRWAAFWGTALGVAVVLALGNYTPITPAVQESFSFTRSFRFPPKYLIIATVALAMLAAHGWQALAFAAARRKPLAWRVKAPAIGLAALFAIAGYIAVLMSLLFRVAFIQVLSSVAIAVHVKDLPRAVSTMLELAQPHGRRLLLVSAGTAFLLWLASSGRRESRLACAALIAVIAADLVVTNSYVNVMTPVAYLDRAEWVGLVQQHPSQRFYFGGRPRGTMDETDIDAPRFVTFPGLLSAEKVRVLAQGAIIIIPSQWGIREAISYDLPMLFSTDYELLVQRFEHSSHEQRRHFLDLLGVRDCVLPKPPRPDAPALASVPIFADAHLYECNASATRVRVLPPWAKIEPSVPTQIDALFRLDFDSRHVVLLREPPPAASGTAGPAVPAPYARLTKDENGAVDIDAGVGPDGGFLFLADTFDDDWHAWVDGAPAPVLRANALYRAVLLKPGPHTVQFRYRPRFVFYGAAISLATVLVLGGVLWFSRRRRGFEGAKDEISSEGLPLSVADQPSDGRRVA
jgi:hypothetical protein